MRTIINNQKKERDILLSRPYLTRHTKYDVDELLASKQINVLDISQTIVQEYFNMMMIVDTTHIDSFDQLSADLETLGKEIGVQVKCQREEIFNMMHRI